MAKINRKGLLKEGDPILYKDNLISPLKRFKKSSKQDSKHISKGFVKDSDPIYKQGWKILIGRNLKWDH